MDVLLWVLFAISTLVYRHIGRAVMFQPADQRTAWAWNPGALNACAVLPLVAIAALAVSYAALTVAGFIFGGRAETGWVLLAASAVALLVFAVRLDRNLLK